MPTQSHIIQRLRPLLGTFVAIEADAASAARVEQAVAAAFAAVVRVAGLMRPATVGSDVQRVSQARAGEAVRVDAWTHEVLKLAADLSRESGGVFDPCRPTKPGRMRDLELGEPGVVVCRAPVALDLGGIAKGFAVDRAIDELAAHGCTAGLVNAGGDLRVFGGRPRAVLARGESAAAGGLQIELADGALAVSAPRSASSPAEHVGYYVGTSGVSVVGCWVAITAPEAAVADALAKCAMLAPPELVAALLLRRRARAITAAGGSVSTGGAAVE